MAKKKRKKKNAKDPILKELEAIKKLLIFFLLKTGVKAGDISDIIEIDPADFSRMMPVRKMKIQLYKIMSKE